MSEGRYLFPSLSRAGTDFKLPREEAKRPLGGFSVPWSLIPQWRCLLLFGQNVCKSGQIQPGRGVLQEGFGQRPCPSQGQRGWDFSGPPANISQRIYPLNMRPSPKSRRSRKQISQRCWLISALSNSFAGRAIRNRPSLNPDMPPDHEALGAIMLATNTGIMEAKEDGSFSLDDVLNGYTARKIMSALKDHL